jgi:hypothetical protein
MGEAMSLTTINVEVPHTLPVEDAVARLTKGEKPSFFALLQSMVATLKLTKVTAEIEADVPGPNVALTVVITKDRVTVESGRVSQLTEWIGERAIESDLKERLK